MRCVGGMLHDLLLGLASYNDTRVYQYGSKSDILAGIAEQLGKVREVNDLEKIHESVLDYI